VVQAIEASDADSARTAMTYLLANCATRLLEEAA
jgi:DNA-binding FadR family transcriptional regulator